MLSLWTKDFRLGFGFSDLLGSAFCFYFGLHRVLAFVLRFVRSRLAIQCLHLNFPIDYPIVR